MIPLLAAALADLCGPVPAEAPDPVDAASYVEVGDRAAEAGDVRVAAIAYRKAVALDAGNTHARAALDELCRADRARPDDAAELLVAIGEYRAGELDDALMHLLAIAERAGAAAPAAHFFLGLVALQRHEGSLAIHELEQAGSDPTYRALAEPMLRIARRDGALAARLLVAPEFDTNPQLLPDTPPAGPMTASRQADVDLSVIAAITARPVRWLVLRDTLVVREQRQIQALDFVGNDVQAGIELDSGRDHVAVRYDFDFDLLDGADYLLASRGTAAYRREFGGFALAASYSLRRRAYQQASEAPFTGWVHEGELGAIAHVSPTFDIDVRGLVVRELTADATFADLAFGGQLGMRMRIAPAVRLAALATGWYAHYDTAEPDGSLRRDLHGEVGGDIEIDLGDYALATCGASAIGNNSSIDDFDYWKLVVRCGVAVAFGGP